MPAIAIKGSITQVAPPAGPFGVVIAGMPNVYAMGSPVAFIGSPLGPHGDPDVEPLCDSGPFISAPGAASASRVFVNGIAVATVGSICNCGHVIATGIANINVGPV